MNDFRYSLDRRPGRQNKHQCPKCGDPKSFRWYIDLRTGLPIDPTCGKCDHVNRCGEHVPPRDYFRMHPEQRDNWQDKHPVDASWAKVGRHAALAAQQAVNQSAKQKGFTLPYNLVEQYHSNRSDFAHWYFLLLTLHPGLDPEVAWQAYHDYMLGATQDRRVVFWQIDAKGRVRSGKIMAYGNDGHRSGYPDWIHSYLMREGKLKSDDWELRQCLFGEHLLSKYPDRDVCLVESEKTALVCSLFHPDKLWLASGGCQGLNAQKLSPLVGRRVTVYPDSGMFHKWYSQLIQVKDLRFNIVNHYERYPQNTDIADVLLGEAKMPGK